MFALQTTFPVSSSIRKDNYPSRILWSELQVAPIGARASIEELSRVRRYVVQKLIIKTASPYNEGYYSFVGRCGKKSGEGRV